MSKIYRRPRRDVRDDVARFAFRAAPLAFRTTLRATFRAAVRAVRVEARALRAGFERRAFATVLLPLRASLFASRCTSFTAVPAPPAIAFCAASAFAAMAPRVDPIDSATLTRRSCDLDEATAGLLKLRSSHATPREAALRTEKQKTGQGSPSRCGDRLAHRRA